MAEAVKKYDAYNSASKMRGFSSIALMGVYAAAITDIIIFGKGYSNFNSGYFKPFINISFNKRERVYQFLMLNVKF
ncbi:MAG: hypothetical protein OEZ22_12865 [Spirochaetia bacterium]|nr:hypothetical protein [Spirochaetia bacterium]